MKALAYLTGKLIANSFRRAVKSPTRIVGIIFMLSWWFMIVVGGFADRRPLRAGAAGERVFSLPAETVLFAIIFSAMLAVFIIRAVSMFQVPGMYRAADPDVLFPTPIKPAHVLMHRFALDYFISLMIPIVLLLFSGKRGIEGIQLLFKDLPDANAARYTGQAFILSFLLLSLFAAALNYAVGMYINRDTEKSRTLRKWLAYCLALGFAALLAAVAGAINSPEPWERLTSIPNSLAVRIVLFPVAAAADLAVAPLYASWAKAVFAGCFLLVGSGVLLWLAARQSSHLYDMAARHAANTQVARDAKQRGDQTLLLLKAAREGKLKPRTLPWLEKMRARGSMAILWREALLTIRTNLALLVMFMLISVGITILQMFDSSGSTLVPMVIGQFFVLISMAIAYGQTGFMETLRRLDVQKPLPFSSARICFYETMGKAVAPTFIAWAASLAILITQPRAWQFAIALAVAAPSFVLVVIAAQLVVILLFPDVDDPTQAAFRGVLQFLGSAIAAAPAFIVAILSAVLVPVVISAFIAVLVNLAVLFLLVQIAAPMYAAFNPTE